jgi:hypothetical protein
MSVAFVLTCLLGINHIQAQPMGYRVRCCWHRISNRRDSPPSGTGMRWGMADVRRQVLAFRLPCGTSLLSLPGFRLGSR